MFVWQSGKKNDKAILVKDILAKLTQATFSMEELSKRPLPEGVDPMKLETYLSNQEFKVRAKMVAVGRRRIMFIL